MFVNDNITNLRPSATLVINEKSKALIAEGKKVVKLGFGQSPFPVPQNVVQALRDNAYQKDYLPVKGLPQLRQEVAIYSKKKFNIDCTAEDVLIGPGSKELLFLTQLVYKGDLILPQPSWVSYAPQAELSSKKCHWIPTTRENEYMLDAETLDKFCRDKNVSKGLLILNYPSNPTGSTFTEDQLKSLAAVAKSHQILVLSDEIYADIHHQGKHKSLAEFYPEGTIMTSGLSKWCGAGGWRLGTFVFPKEKRWLLDQIAVAASETYSCASAPIQFAAITAFKGGEIIDEYLRCSRLVLKIIADDVHALLSQSQISCPKPLGGFYLMLDFSNFSEGLKKRGIVTSKRLCEALLEECSVALLPLEAFGFPENFLGARLSYVDFDGELALKLVKENPNVQAMKLAPVVIDGVKLLCTWVHNNKY